MDPADQTMSKRISILTRLYAQHRLSHSLFHLCLPVNDIPWCPYFTRLIPLCLPSLSQHLRFVQAQSPPHPFSPLPCLNCISPSFDSLQPLSFSSITVSLSNLNPIPAPHHSNSQPSLPANTPRKRWPPAPSFLMAPYGISSAGDGRSQSSSA